MLHTAPARAVAMTVLELLVERDGDRVLLCAPEVGWFAGALAKGAVLAESQAAGSISTLGVVRHLVVPAGVFGRVVSSGFERAREPVGYGDVLYELAPLAGAAADANSAESTSAGAAAQLVFRSPQSGRFWYAASPRATPLVKVGDTVRDAQPIGLIEVMKTFSYVTYRASVALPPVARIARVLVQDGADVRSGDALFEVEEV